MKTIFILYWGGEDGSREDCSIFYTKSKAYTTRALAKGAAKRLKIDNDGLIADEDDDAITEGFYTHIVGCELAS